MRRAVRVGAGILVGVLALPCLALAGGGGAWAGGAGDKALRVSVTVNGRGFGADGPTPVRAGRDVVKRYRLVNGGGADLHGVRVRDPGIPSGTGVRCPRRTLVGLTSMECVARFRALPGTRTATVRAEGRIPSLGLTAAATARSGYTGVTGSLVLGERVRPGAAGATLTYTVTNQGNRALRDVRVTDPALGLSGDAVDCGGRPGLVPVLAPGTSARCTATVRRPSGTHRSTGLATGTDRIGTYAPDGRVVPAPLLTARAAGSFTVPEREAGREPEPTREPGGEVGAGPGAAGPGAGAEAEAGAGGGGGGGAPPGVPRPAPGAAGAPGAPGTPAAPGAGAGAVGTPGAPGVPAGAGAAASVAAAAVPPAVGPLPVGPPAPDAPPALAAVGAGAPAPAPADAEAVDAGPGAVEAMAGTGAGTAPVAGVAGEGRVETPPAAREAAGAGEAPVSGRAPAEEARRAAALGDEGFLGRVRRRGREADEMGVVVMLLLILVPAALAAALLGNRRN
ncbi:hypothetical protein [Streptomyces sp. NPDC085466]|uniref:DUF7507 domain-containing protein n=1 Tax=Streptomyces sp. NPDC085466 TaxID=3365725 RepID=UPI0037D1CB1A